MRTWLSEKLPQVHSLLGKWTYIHWNIPEAIELLDLMTELKSNA